MPPPNLFSPYGIFMAKKHDALKDGGAVLPDFRNQRELAPLLEDLLRKAGKPLGMDAILRISGFPRKAKKHIEAALYALQQQEKVLRVSGNWTLRSGLRQVSGRLSVQRAGMGFVAPEGGGPDIYVHPTALNGAWPGDKVEVVVLPGKHGPNREGRVMRVLERTYTEIPVHAFKQQRNKLWLCTPVDPRIPALFLTRTGSLPDPVEAGDLLLVRPEEEESANVWTAEVTVNLQHECSPAAQERVAKLQHGIPGPFPAAALAEAAAFAADPSEDDLNGRKDLRDVSFVTIDGRTAKDFDDAVHVEETADGFRLRVAIADVSHYVRAGSALDAEARLRGNSCYFPLSVEPMLPEALSNGLCSLKPDVLRLAVVADMHFSPEGAPGKTAFYTAVIRSCARLTYGQIERGVLLHEREEEERLAPVLPMLRTAERLARKLAVRRVERGSLDFDLPEAEIRMDEQGRIAAVVPARRHFGHRLIEECMIAANEAVAAFLERRGAALLFRVHLPPDQEKLQSLAEFLARSGLGGKEALQGRSRRKAWTPSAGDLQRIIAEAGSSPESYVVVRLILRSMMQARYQSENEGHFGLGSACYCHFTSPIRRYADLLVHRVLKRVLGAADEPGMKPLSAARLDDIALHINTTERTAMAAERDVHKRFAVLYLQDKVGGDFAGTISGVSDFGLFVELPEVMAEGLVRLSLLDDDYYEYVPERQELVGRGTRRRYRLGDSMPVTLTDVSLGRLEINLAPAGRKEGLAPRERKPGRKPGGRPAARPGSSGNPGRAQRRSGDTKKRRR